MMPQVLDPCGNHCTLAARWGIDPSLALKLLAAASRLEFPLYIISGSRSRSEQDALRASGRGAASEALSTHRTTPATGADLRVGTAATNFVKVRVGAEATIVGLRWGGGSAPDPETGIPTDWNHVDLGARRG